MGALVDLAAVVGAIVVLAIIGYGLLHVDLGQLLTQACRFFGGC